MFVYSFACRNINCAETLLPRTFPSCPCCEKMVITDVQKSEDGDQPASSRSLNRIIAVRCVSEYFRIQTGDAERKVADQTARMRGLIGSFLFAYAK